MAVHYPLLATDRIRSALSGADRRGQPKGDRVSLVGPAVKTILAGLVPDDDEPFGVLFGDQGGTIPTSEPYLNLVDKTVVYPLSGLVYDPYASVPVDIDGTKTLFLLPVFAKYVEALDVVKDNLKPGSYKIRVPAWAPDNIIVEPKKTPGFYAHEGWSPPYVKDIVAMVYGQAAVLGPGKSFDVWRVGKDGTETVVGKIHVHNPTALSIETDHMLGTKDSTIVFTGKDGVFGTVKI